MRGLSKLTKVVTKIGEVIHWAGVVLMAIAVICTAAAPDLLRYQVGDEAKQSGSMLLEVYGFRINAPIVDGRIDTRAFILFGIACVIVLSLMAMVFRNLHLVAKLSEGSTPFQPDNVRMIREIGIFSIAIPIVGLILSTIVRLVIGVDAVESSVDQSGLVMGLAMLFLSQCFARGVSLEKDVDGLL